MHRNTAPPPHRPTETLKYRNTAPPQPRLKSITFLDPDRLHHVIEDHHLIGWRYNDPSKDSPAQSQVFLPEELWFERLPNPFDHWRGLAPLQLASRPATTDFTAANFMRGLLDSNGDLGTIVRTTDQLTEEQRQQVLSALVNRRRCAGNPHQPLLLSDAIEVIQPSLSSADLQFLENRKFSRAEICAAFGVPEEIVSTTDHNKYDVMQGARLNFIENRIAPLCARLEAEEQQTVRALDPTAVGWFDLDSLPIMQQARRARLVTAKTGFDMGIPFNHLNRVLDLGFPEFPWGNSGFLPNTLQTLSSSPSSSCSSSPPAPPPNPNPPTESQPPPSAASVVQGTQLPMSPAAMLHLLKDINSTFKST